MKITWNKDRSGLIMAGPVLFLTFAIAPSFMLHRLTSILVLTAVLCGCKHRQLIEKAGEQLSNADSLLFYHHHTETEKKHEIKGRRLQFVVDTVHIVIYKPLGRDISDTTRHDDHFLKRLVNNTHVRTRTSAVRRLLLFGEGDTIGRLHITESERLLRRNLKIRDARIIASPSKKDPAHYEVTVLLQDQIAYNIGILDLNNITTYRLANRNLGGTGTTLEAGLALSDNTYDHYTLYYYNPSLLNSYVDLSLSYSSAGSNFTRGARINKNFASGLFTWAGGGGYIYRNTDRYFYIGKEVAGGYNSALQQSDAWAARAFPLKFGRDQRPDYTMRDFVVAARYIHNEESVSGVYLSGDSIFPVVNRSGDKLLLSYGLSFRRYYKDSYIFRFKYSEDIPEGFLFSLLFGKSFNTHYNDNYYFGLSAGLANNNRFGYWNLTYQQIYSASRFSVFHNFTNQLRLVYLTPLLAERRFKDRIFFTARFTGIGNDVAFDRLTLTNDDGFLNVNSKVLSGLTKVSCTVNNIVYTPYRPLGFNIGFFVYAAFANLSPVQDVLLDKKWYQAYGIGILLRNENLLINSIRLSFTYYPSFPETSFRFNPLWIYDLQIPDMSMNQPEYELY